jgi:hypothetical protein
VIEALFICLTVLIIGWLGAWRARHGKLRLESERMRLALTPQAEREPAAWDAYQRA